MSAESHSPAEGIARSSKRAFEASQLVPPGERTKALEIVRRCLAEKRDAIFQANKRDLEAAAQEVAAGRLSASLLKRLDLTSGDKFDSMLQGISEVAALPDPTGKITYASELDDELELYRVTCPIGSLLVIFEARPEVVVNITALAIKSGNSAILKGGKESVQTTTVLSQVIRSALSQTALHQDYIQTVNTRDEIASLLDQDKYIDLVIPRGSNALVKSIQKASKIPVMGHADGICSVFLDKDADMSKSIRIVVDAKTDYPSACNAAEILILHGDLPSPVWQAVSFALLEADVHIRCDSVSLSKLPNLPGISSHPRFSTHIHPADPASDFDTEHLAHIISVATASSLDEAIKFINQHGSHHTDVIVTESEDAAATFMKGVDSAGTFWNASSRFADGFRYGFGTEVGISTGKTHARGPVGLEGLVIYKYMLKSKAKGGHIVGEYGSKEGQKSFKHRPLQTLTLPF